MNSPRLPLALILALAGTLPSHSQTIPDIAPEIVSAWKADVGDALLIFRYDGVYFQVQDDASRPGMERGTFTWNKATNAFSASAVCDTNGESGLSHPAGATTLSVSGNTLTYTVAGEWSFTFSRVVNTASAIVGSWFIPGDPTTVTFLAGSISGNVSTGIYYSTEEEDDAPFEYDGMERGTYTWNSSSKVLTASPITDTNGDTGLSNLPAGFTATIVGNAMTVPDDGGTTVLRRITPILSPLNTENDFEVDQFANYRQTSAAAPVLLPVPVPPGDDHPFWGEAYIEGIEGIEGSVTGIGVTLTIASQAPRDFEEDTFVDGAGNTVTDFVIESDYLSLNDLNQANAFPNGVNYLFSIEGGTATLSYPANGDFPPAPVILDGDGNGTWSNGEFILDENETLIWGAHTAYDPATLVTVLSAVDMETDEELLYEVVIQGDITSFDFRGKLIPGRSYRVQLEHVKIAGSTTSGTGYFAGKLGYALYNSNTRFTMVAPEGSTSDPVITQQPISQLPAAGAKVTLTVGTDGQDQTLTYQWYQNNQAIPGQIGNSLTILNYSNAADGGSYTVEVSNAAGSVTSNPATLGLPTVKSITLSKDIEYIQTGPSTVIVNPEGITPTHAGTYGFFTEVKGSNLASITAPTVTPPAGTLPFQNTLEYNAGDLLWGYGLNGDEFNTDTQALIDSKFPNGTYTFLVNGVSVPLSLPGNSFYSNTPQFTLNGGSWVNGKYAMDAANSLTITTNVFAQYSSNVDGRISLRINEGLKQELFASSSPSSNFASYTVPSFTFGVDTVNEILVDFDAIISKSNAIPGAFAAAYYTKSLFVDVHILPKITTQSTSEVVGFGSNLTLQAIATGTPLTNSINGIPLEPIGMNYQWSKGGMVLVGKTASTLQLINFQAADAGTYTCTVTNDVGSATTQPIHLEFADAFQSYAASFGLNSVTTGAPDADFDKDGIPNLLEYLLGGNPTLPSSGLLPTVTKAPGSNNLVFTYKRKIAATGVSQVIEHATNLSSTWSPAVNGQSGVTIITVVVPGDPTAEQVTVTIPSTSTSRFVRLKAGR